MWPQQMWGQRSSRGQWPLFQFFAKTVTVSTYLMYVQAKLVVPEPLVFLFFFFFFFFLLIAWSKFALIFHIARFQFQKYKIFSFWEGTSPCVCMLAHTGGVWGGVWGHIPLRHPLCVQACNWRWRSTKSSPNVEDGCTALCSFGVLAVVKCCKQCFIAMVFFFFSYT